MSLQQTTCGYALGPDEGEAVWFDGGLGLLLATGEQTEGRFAAFELRMRKDFCAPLHVHRDDDEFFLVLDGEIRIQLGENVIEGVPGLLVYGPRDVPHSFRVTPRRRACSRCSDPRTSRASSERAASQLAPGLCPPPRRTSSTRRNS